LNGDSSFDTPTYSLWIRRGNIRKWMNLKGINGGSGRASAFDLPIMSRGNTLVLF